MEILGGAQRWRISWLLGLQDIELRYKRSLLGPFWISAALLVTVLALAYVFAEVFGSELVPYISFLGTGLLAWQLLLALVNEGAGAVAENAGILNNVPMPLSVIAGRILVRNAIVFAHNFVAIAGLLVLFGAGVSPTLWAVVPGVLTILLLGFVLTLAIAPLCARFRDVPLVLSSLMQIMFFLTPIFWMPSSTEHRPMFVAFNPFYHFIELVRAPMLGGLATEVNWTVALSSCAAIGLMAIVVLSLTHKRITLWL